MEWSDRRTYVTSVCGENGHFDWDGKRGCGCVWEAGVRPGANAPKTSEVRLPRSCRIRDVAATLLARNGSLHCSFIAALEAAKIAQIRSK